MKITLLGNNLIARHFAKYLENCQQSVQISLWTFDYDQYPEFEGLSTCLRYHGIKNLPNALLAADVVVNLHDCTDFSLLPDTAKLQMHNVEIVRSVIFHSNAPLVHLSTPFLQCSHRWPNVYEPERDPIVFKPQWPFPEYCASKFEAEQLVKAATNDSYIIRCVPTYGEGDNCSILTDLIYFSNDNTVFSLGDDDGHMQMAYAGNVSTAIWSAVCSLLYRSTSFEFNESFEGKLSELLTSADNSFIFDQENEKIFGNNSELNVLIDEKDENLEGYRARHNTVRTISVEDCESKGDFIGNSVQEFDVFEQDGTALNGSASSLEQLSTQSIDFSAFNAVNLSSDKKRIFEIFLINDTTPMKTVYNTYGPLLYTGKRIRSATQLPFIPLYYIYLFLSMLIQFAIKLLGPLEFATYLPSPSFLYFYFHHWTFFNSTKSLLVLGYKPKFEFSESINNCVKHYREIRKKDVRRFSWQNSVVGSSEASKATVAY